MDLGDIFLYFIVLGPIFVFAGSILILYKKKTFPRMSAVVLSGFLAAYVFFCVLYTAQSYQGYRIRAAPTQFVQDVAAAMVLLPMNQISIYRYGHGLII